MFILYISTYNSRFLISAEVGLNEKKRYTESEVTSSIEKILSDSCSSCPNYSAKTPYLPTYKNFDLRAKNRTRG